VAVCQEGVRSSRTHLHWPGGNFVCLVFVQGSFFFSGLHHFLHKTVEGSHSSQANLMKFSPSWHLQCGILNTRLEFSFLSAMIQKKFTSTLTPSIIFKISLVLMNLSSTLLMGCTLLLLLSRLWCEDCFQQKFFLTDNNISLQSRLSRHAQ